jgi:hypothetical protein
VPLLPGFSWAGFPDLNRSQQMAIAELVSHGGSAADVRRMAEYFKQQAGEAESQQPTTEIPES